MKTKQFILLLLLIHLSVFSQTKNAVYKESGFSATFPETLKMDSKVLDSKIGVVNMKLYLAEGDDFMIMVSESKYPDEILKSMTPERAKNMMDGAKNGALNNLSKQMNAEYIEKKGEDFLFDNKYVGNTFTGSVNDTDILGKTFIKKTQMYQILVLGNVTSKEALTFLDSFKLIE